MLWLLECGLCKISPTKGTAVWSSLSDPGEKGNDGADAPRGAAPMNLDFVSSRVSVLARTSLFWFVLGTVMRKRRLFHWFTTSCWARYSATNLRAYVWLIPAFCAS